MVLCTITPVFYVTSSYIYVILCLYTGPPFCQYRKVCPTTVCKTATNCLFVRLLVAENDKAKKRSYDSGQKNWLRKEHVDRKVIVM